MKSMLLFTVLFILCVPSHAQDSTGTVARKSTPYMAKVRLMNDQFEKGWLYNLNDSQVILLKGNAKMLKQVRQSPTDFAHLGTTLPVSQIQSISTHKKSSAVKGMLIGLGAGIVTGAVIGLVEGDDPVATYNPNDYADPFSGILGGMAVALQNAFAMSAGEKAIAYGATLGLTGALTGAVVGALAKKKFIIGGKKEKFRDLHDPLMRRLMIRE